MSPFVRMMGRILLAITILWASPARAATVIVYVSEEQVFSEPVLKDFERETGIEVKAVYDTEETTGYVYLDAATRDIGGYVNSARRAIGTQLKLPPGYTLQWTGQYEFQVRARERLTILIPIVFFIIPVIFYMVRALRKGRLKASGMTL